MKKLIYVLIIAVLSGFGITAKAVTVTKTVGTTGADYATLKLAFDAINNGTLTGDVVLQIVDNTSEAAIASLNASGVNSASYTSVLIYPTFANLSILADAALAASSYPIDLNGADNVTIDGRVNQTGARNLTIAATTTSASTLILRADATYNTIKYCNIKGNVTSAKGVLSFSTGTTLGNSNNLIDHNLFTNNGTRPLNAILSTGTAGVPNSTNTISNNEFKNCFAYATTGSIIIYLNGQSATGTSNSGWTISGNSFYETGTITNASGINGAMGFINIVSCTKTLTGTGYLIENNYIGGTAAQCGGGTFTKDGVGAGISGILVYLGVAGNTCSIQNNTIQKISWTNSTTATFRGIEVIGVGDYDIGTTTGNTIGDNTTEGSILITNATTASAVTGINILATGTVNCKNNKIGSIKSVNTNTTVTSTSVYGITKTGAGTANIVGNIIGSATMANSIYATSTANSSNAYGINFQGTATNNTIKNNTISNISTNTTASGYCYGIGLSTGGTTTVNGNFIHSLTTASNSTTTQVFGIGCGASTSSLVTNNVIALVGNNNPAIIYGINDDAAAVSTSIYHNTVYIGGAPTNLALKSYAFYSGVSILASPTPTLATATRFIKNNIFVNGRLNNGATGNNAAVGLANFTGGISAFEWDNNDLWSSGNGYNVFAYFNGSVKTFSTWKGSYTGLDANSLNNDPSFANAGGTLAPNYKTSSAVTSSASTGITADYDETSRSANQMGAYFISAAATPTISTTGSLSAVNTTYGTASSNTQFSVSGANMQAGILVTPPAGYEVSLSSGSGYAATVTVTGTGTIASTPIYVRLAATASVGSSPYSGNIQLTSTSASQVNVATASSTVSAKALTITANNVNKTYGTLLTGAAGSTAFTTSAMANSETIGAVTITYGTGSAADAAVNTYSSSAVVPSVATGGTFSASNYSLTYTAGNIIVSPKALTITAANQTVSYGTAAATVTGAGSYTPTGFVNSETASVISGSATYSTSYTNSTAAGTSGVTITPIITGLTATNYSFTPADGTITVSAATPTVTVTPIGTYTYDGNPQGPIAATNTGTGTSYTFSYVGTGYTASPTRPTELGTYTATATVAAHGNYAQSSSIATVFNITTETVNTGGNLSDIVLTDPQLANTNITVSSGELIINATKTVRSITVNSGAKLTIPTGQALTLTSLTLKSDATGTSTYKPEGTGALTVTGTTNVEQYLANTRNYYVSSPVSNAVAPAGFTYYGRNETLSNLGWVAVSVGAGLTAGKGYIALPGTGDAPITFTTQSGGTLNTGTIPVSLTYTSLATSGKGYNLIGNPYPSHLSWTYEFTQANIATIESSIWYRTKVGNGNTGGWSFVTFNPTSALTVPSTANGGLIPPMQGFWVLAKQTGSILFTNDMRSHETGNPLRVKAAQSADRKKVRLQVSNGTRADEALIFFDANATDGYDAYDSPKMMNNATDIADIYTVTDAKKLVINGLNTVKYDTEIPIGFSTVSAGDFSISANEFSNFEVGTRLILLDKNYPTIENELTPETAYHFSAPVTAASTNRFSLLFRAPGNATGLNNTEKLHAQVFVNAANQITIIAAEKSKYAIYNAVGQLMENGATTSNYQTSNAKLNAGVYVVKVGNQSNRVIVK